MKLAVKFALLPLLLFLAIFSRFYALMISPPSPYWEEVALGYDAYNITLTGRDHHGNFLPLSSFESFGDHKPSLYFYAAVPFIKIFGLNLLAVRLPTILASLALILGTAVLSRFLFLHFYRPKDKQAANFVFHSSLFLGTISPWLLVFSRSAWESVLASALILWGFIFGLFFIKSNRSKWLILATLLLTLSTYAYHSARLTAPLLGLSVMAAYFVYHRLTVKKISHQFNWRALLLAAILGLIMIYPVTISLLGQSGQQRIAETSIFNDLNLIEESNEWRAAYKNTWLARAFFHRYVFFAREAILNFASHFSYNYLFVSGDNNPRHSIQTFGNFYYLDLLLFIFAGYFLLRQRRKISLLLFAFLLLGILPAAFTKATPHALRTLTAWPVFIVLLSFAWWQLVELCKLKMTPKILNTVLTLAYLVFFATFFYQLIFIYPKKYRHEWQFGYEEMVGKLLDREANYEQIYITREQGRPAMYYFYYAQVEPRLVQTANETARKDQGEFLNFGKISFIDQADELDLSKSILLISSPEFRAANFNQQALKLIDQTEGEVWSFYEN